MSPTSFWLDKLREDWTRDERERAERAEARVAELEAAVELANREALLLRARIMVAGLQYRNRRRTEGTLCNRHGQFPHAPRPDSPKGGGQ